MSSMPAALSCHRPRAVILLLGTGLLLAGCSEPPRFAYEPPPATPVPQRIHARFVPYRYLVHFDTDRDRPNADERARLTAFLQSLPRTEGARVRVVGHADERLGSPYNADLAARRARTVARLLEEQGFHNIRISTASFGEGLPAAGSTAAPRLARDRRVEISIQIPVITLPGCPDWSAPDLRGAGNHAMSQLGCATALNLAATIADPADLITGRDLAPADGIEQAAGVRRYHEDRVKDLIDWNKTGTSGKKKK